MSAAIAVAVAAMFGSGARAVPAFPELMRMTQPDGTTINVRLVGDENGHYYLSEDGLLLFEQEGAFYYAVAAADGTLGPSPMRAAAPGARTPEAVALLDAQNQFEMTRAVAAGLAGRQRRISPRARRSFDVPAAAPRAVEDGSGMVPPSLPLPGLFPGSDFPTLGSPNVLVILVNFADLSFATPDANAVFSAQLKQPSYRQRGFTGSALDYFSTASMGQFTPNFHVYGPVRLPRAMAYYGGNDSGGNDLHPREMVVDALTALSQNVDYSIFDNNGDGVVDNVFIYYAGRGEASGGGANTIWPHSWDLGSLSPTFNGVTFSSYACANELNATAYGVEPAPIGTFCHEFGHVMGLPDLYSSAYTADNHPGGWALMASGSYTNDSRTPPTLSSWERGALGWLTPTVLNHEGEFSLQPSLQLTNQAYLIPTKHSNEYFMLESRLPLVDSWDEYVPSAGMLVWHIDFQPGVWNQNGVNNNPDHQYADIEEAHGKPSVQYYHYYDCFPFGSKSKSLTHTTTPNLKAWDGSLTDITLPQIWDNEDEDSDSDDYANYVVSFTTHSVSGVRNVLTDAGVTFRTEGMTLTVYGADGRRVDLYTIDGRLAGSCMAPATLTAPAPGLYIAVCGSQRVKVLF